MGLWDIEKIPYIGREKGPQEGLAFHYYEDRKSVVQGKSVFACVDLGGRRIIKKKKKTQ